MTVDISPAARRTIRLDHLQGVYRVGSFEWSWQEEYANLMLRDATKMAALIDSIRAEGIREPILLGDDGRVWDGHHRICAAMHIGLDAVPVEFCTPARVTPTREQIAELHLKHWVFDAEYRGTDHGLEKWVSVCDCGWESSVWGTQEAAKREHGEHFADALATLLAGLVEAAV